MGQERDESLGQCPVWLGKLGTRYTLTFPVGQISGWWSLFTHFSLSLLGGEMRCVKWNCSSYPLQCIYSQIFWFNRVLRPHCWTPQLWNSALICEWLTKSCFLWRTSTDNSCWHHSPRLFPSLHCTVHTMDKLKLLSFFRTNKRSFMITLDITGIFMILSSDIWNKVNKFNKIYKIPDHLFKYKKIGYQRNGPELL